MMDVSARRRRLRDREILRMHSYAPLGCVETEKMTRKNSDGVRRTRVCILG